MLGRAARYDENSKRSMTGTSKVSDSFLKPVMSNGELINVREVDIIGEVYVRIAGRDEVERVSLDGFRIVKVTMKLPMNQRKTWIARTYFKIVPRTRQLELNKGSIRLTAEHVRLCEIDSCPWGDIVTVSLVFGMD